MNQQFIHLRICSSYSLLRGAIKIPKILSLCQENNMPAVGISDYNSMFGVLEFSSTLSKGGVQPIIGTILSISTSNAVNNDNKNFSDVLLIAQNEIGYKNLMHMVSQAYLTYAVDNIPCFPYDKIAKYSDGVIFLTGGVKGIIGKQLKQGNIDIAASQLADLKDIFKDRLYVEIIRDSNEIIVEDDMLNLAYDYNVPIVATNNIFFPTPDMVEAHDVLMCIGAGKFLVDDDREKSLADYYFKSQEEMLTLFGDLKEATENTLVIAERCSYMSYERKPMLPKVDLSGGRTPDEELRVKAEAGLLRRLEAGNITDPEEREKYYQRFNYELGVIAKMGFSSYFLIVADFIGWAVKNNVPVGPGRGSGAGSMVAWCLRITNLDPIKFRLIFERFLNPERVSMPDFDVDFCQDKRERVIDYVCNKYGHDKVGHIIAFGKLQARVVIRDVGRVLGMGYGFVDKISKMVPQNPTNPLTLEQAIDVEPLLKKAIEEDEQVKRLIDISLKLEGLSRHASTHAAGIVIANQPLDDLVPLYKDPKSDIPVTQFNMKFVEKAGLVKFDFLGLKTLTALQQTVELLKDRGIDVDLDTIPLDDQKTFDMVNRIETVGIFQLESTGMRDVIRKLKPDHFEDFVALVALYRPGPMDDIPKYVARKHGIEPIEYPHEMLVDILAPTYGVMVYQEQVMQIAQVIAGYTLGQADLLRRAMGKKIKAEMDLQKERFVSGCMKNGVSKEKAESLFDQISKFAGYGFNKSHATPYALLSYQTAYLKANYPVEFMTALMNLDKGNTDKLSYFKQELDRIHIALLPPDINKSKCNFSVEDVNGKLAIRYGLSAVKGAGEVAMTALCDERERNGEFKNISDFLSRVSEKVINKKQLEVLICAGAFDMLHNNRRELFMNVTNMSNFYEISKNKRQCSLFGGDVETIQLKRYNEWSELEKLSEEYGALGFYLSSHPMLGIQDELKIYGVKTYREVLDTIDSEMSTSMAGIIVKVVKKISKTGNRFVFLHLSDTTGAYEVVVFSEVLTKYSEFLIEGNIIIVNASVKQEGDMLRITAWEIKPFVSHSMKESSKRNNMKDLTISIKNMEELNYVKSLIDDLPKGDSTISLIINGTKMTLALKYDLNDEIIKLADMNYKLN